MNITQYKWRNTIFSRLVVTFLLIMIPIYALGIYIYNWGLYTVKSEISKSTVAQASFYIEGLEKEIERIRILQYDCLNDDNLGKLVYRSQTMKYYDFMEKVVQLQQRLLSIKNSSVYIKNVSVHILPIKKTISTTNGVDDIDKEKFEQIRVPPGLYGAQIISYHGGMYLSTMKQSNSLNSVSQYMIEIELNQDAFRQALAQFNTYKESGSFLISLVNNGIIANQADGGNVFSIENILKNISDKDNKGIQFVKTGNKGYLLVHAKSDYLNMELVRYIPEELVLKPLRSFYTWVWVFSIAAICIILVYSFSTYKFMHKPLLELVKSFRKVEGGDLQVSIQHDSNNEFGYLYKRFNEMVKNLNALIEQIYRQKILMQRAELKQLQSQINPHFLYNSFFVLNTMAKIGDNDNLIVFTKQLGEYFRFVTRSASDDIPLADEVHHAQVYANIQAMRFSKRIHIEFSELPGEFAGLLVPRLIIQPIIENSFKHSLEKKGSNGLIRVCFEKAQSELRIVVEDNGEDLTDTDLDLLQKALNDDGEDSEVTGIINIHRRIRLVFGMESGLQVLRSELGGLKAVIMVKTKGEGSDVQTITG